MARVDVEGRVGKTREEITRWRTEAEKRAPCVLLLDGLDLLLVSENEVSRVVVRS